MSTGNTILNSCKLIKVTPIFPLFCWCYLIFWRWIYPPFIAATHGDIFNIFQLSLAEHQKTCGYVGFLWVTFLLLPLSGWEVFKTRNQKLSVRIPTVSMFWNLKNCPRQVVVIFFCDTIFRPFSMKPPSVIKLSTGLWSHLANVGSHWCCRWRWRHGIEGQVLPGTIQKLGNKPKKQLSSVKNLTAGSCKCPSWIVIEGSLDVKLPTIWTDEK